MSSQYCYMDRQGKIDEDMDFHEFPDFPASGAKFEMDRSGDRNLVRELTRFPASLGTVTLLALL